MKGRFREFSPYHQRHRAVCGGDAESIAWCVTHLIARPLKDMASAARGLALGDISQEITLVRKDEVGEVADAFRSLITYQREVAEVAEAMAQGDLTQNIEPKSDKDTWARLLSR